MLKFLNIFAISLICTAIVNSQLVDQQFSEFGDFNIDDHSIEKRNIFETFRDFTSGSSDSSSDPSKLLVNRRIYNSSIALTIPFFSFKVPNLPDAGFIAKQSIFGAFAWGIVALPFFLSFIFTGSVPSDAQSRSFQRLSDKAKKSSFNFLGPDFSKSFGMDGGQCIQKVICQSHRVKEGRKYGILATSLRTLFPIPEKNMTIGSDTSLFQSAALAGKYGGGKDCDNLFDCILDPLGSLRYLIHWYSHKNQNAQFLLKMIDYDAPKTANSTITTVRNETL
ncbi:uncharacterized protein LOC110844754 isoform X1 [Folsomia candida]|uniref:Uncharacterized protein n=1 Tax=Folsomia candida TaxID=158441 RepID=A0A226EVV8_FOLCA|nr:uncharacterized protein LOC110844754 isoform X1 [Folsomia candida]OXA60981.1 hypothetical protein Fcan01_05604 [Folsomia candida]